MKKTLKLENYYSPDRKHVSNSMISTYLKSPALYKKKYIDKTIRRKPPTPAMVLGLMVDHVLTQPDDFPYMRKVLKKDDPEIYEMQKEMDSQYLVTDALWEKFEQIVETLDEQPFWQDGLKKARFQEVLAGEIEGVEVCGLPDRIDNLKDKKFRITDVKVVSMMKTANVHKWSRNAVDMGYVRQAAMYRELLAQKEGVSVEDIEFFHAVASFQEDGFVKIDLYKVEPGIMDHAFIEIREALQGIKKNIFPKQMLTWDDYAPIQLYGYPKELK